MTVARSNNVGLRPRVRHTIVVVLICIGLTLVAGLFLALVPLEADIMFGVLLVGTVMLAVAVFLQACLTYSLRDASLLLVLAFFLSLGAEYSGVTWGFPFGGPYSYHDAIRPVLFDKVPLFIPFAWFVLAYAPLVFFRPLLCQGDERKHGWIALLSHAMLCGACLTVADFLLDPLAISVGAWTWHVEGAYLGIPLFNFAGWFLVSFLIYVAFFVLKTPASGGFEGLTVTLDRLSVLGAIAFTTAALIALWRVHKSLQPAVFVLPTLVPVWVFWFRARFA